MPSRLTSLSSLHRQHLLAEFAGLRQACPSGIFVSLTPGDPSLWSGVLFVRDGPYASAILRFQISFPDRYPSLPPLVTFATDIFHPLVTPLTTYTYTTDIQDGGTVSATDEERLPPGGFSLRHGFPSWFGRATRIRKSSVQYQQYQQQHQQQQQQQQPPQQPQQPGQQHQSVHRTPPRTSASGSIPSTQSTPEPRSTLPTYKQTSRVGVANTVSTYDVLQYIRSTFDDEAALDAIPLEAAGNPGAWHAWRSHQRELGKMKQQGKTQPQSHGESTTGTTNTTATTATVTDGAVRPGTGTGASSESTWNWEHVWEERVKNGITASLSDPVLYGSAGAADEVIRFLNLEDNDVEAIKDNLKRTMGVNP